MSLNNSILYKKNFINTKLKSILTNTLGAANVSFQEDYDLLVALCELSFEELMELYNLETYDFKTTVDDRFISNQLNTYKLLSLINSLSNSILEEYNKFSTYEVGKINHLDKLKTIIDQKISSIDVLNHLYSYIWKDDYLNNDGLDKKTNLLIENNFVTLPVISNSKVPVNGVSIGQLSVGTFGSTDENYPNQNELSDVLGGSSIQWQEINNRACILELELSLNQDIVNQITIDLDSLPTLDSCKINYIKAVSNTGIVVLRDSLDLTLGSNKIVFYPISTNRIIIQFEQTGSYSVTSSTGTSYKRKAIKLSNVQLSRNKYASEGSLFSKDVDINYKVYSCSPKINILSTNKNLYNLVGNYSLGQNEQFTFDTIGSSLTINKLLYNFNLSRLDSAFSINSSLYPITNTFDIYTQIELISPFKSPASIVLSKKPINSSISLYRPNIFKVGGSLKSFDIGKGKGIQSYHRLNKPIDQEIASTSILKVNNQKWTYVESLVDQTSDAKVWTLDPDYYDLIKFGDNIEGAAPADGSVISFSLDLELCKFTQKDSSYFHKPKYDFDPDKDQIDLYAVLENKLAGKTILTKNVRSIKLQYQNLVNDSLVFTEKTLTGVNYGSPVITNEETFVDGSSELNSTGDYSVDYKNGYIYLYTPIPQDDVATVTFSFYPTRLISKDDYSIVYTDKIEGISFSSSKLPVKTIRDDIQDHSFNIKTLTIEGLLDSAFVAPAPSDNLLHLSRKGIIKGTCNATNLFTNVDIVPEEIDFIDGYTEFLGLIKVDTEYTPSFTGSGVKSFTIFGAENYYSPLSISFSDTSYFTTEKALLVDVNSEGEYFIDSNGTVSVYVVDGLPSTIKYSYYYRNNSFVAINKFSINYNYGTLHSITTWKTGGYIEYQTTNIYMSYNVIDLFTSYEFDSSNNIISFKPEKLLATSDIIKVAYPINSLDFNIKELKDYYSPIIDSIEFRFK